MAAMATESGERSCLLVPGVTQLTDRLRRILVDAWTKAGPNRQRVRAAVDTCSSQTLVSAGLAADMSCAMSATSISITGINGSPLPVQGSVCLYMSGMDGSVQLSQYDTFCIHIVVNSLGYIDVDMVVSMDTISALGGVDMRYGDGRLRQVVFGVSCAVADNQASAAICHRVS